MQKIIPYFTASFVAGNISGWLSVTVGQPLDYIKTQIQTKNHIPHLHHLYHTIGLKGLYKGASSIYMFVGIIGALQFYTFETAIHLLTTSQHKNNMYQLGIKEKICAGFITGFLSAFIYAPTEYVKIQCQLSKSAGGSASLMFDLIRKEKVVGLRKLFTGLPITVVKQAPGAGIYYGGYHSLIQFTHHTRDNISVVGQMLAGGCAGLLFQLYSYPLDTIKTNIQSGQKTWEQMRKQQFWRGKAFKAGFKICLIRGLVVDATNFTTYENIFSLLNKTLE